MGDNEHGLALFCQIQHNIQHFSYHLRIQCRGHFIEQQDLRMHAQCPDDGYTLLLSTGQLSGITLCLICQSHARQKLHGLLLCLCLIALLYLDRCQRNIVQYRQMREQFIALKYHTDLLTQGGDIFTALADIHALQLYRTALNRFQCINTPKQRTLTTAAGTYHYQNISLFYFQIDAVQDLLAFIFFCQIFYLQQCLCHVFTPFSFRLRFHF